MANSTVYAVTNRILEFAGDQPISSTSDFDAETNLSRNQLMAKRFVDKVNRRLGRTSRLRQQKRVATLSLTDASNEYTLPSGVFVEDIVAKSVRCITADKGYGPLRYMTYSQWMNKFPNGETSQGLPMFYFDYPPDGTGVDSLGFSAPANQDLTIQYEYYVVPGSTSTHTDTIFLNTRCEDILWDYGSRWLELVMSQGKSGEYAAVVDALIDELRQWDFGSAEKQAGIDLGFKICGTVQKNTGGLRAHSPD